MVFLVPSRAGGGLYKPYIISLMSYISLIWRGSQIIKRVKTSGKIKRKYVKEGLFHRKYFQPCEFRYICVRREIDPFI
jgi:hypothetical protein